MSALTDAGALAVLDRAAGISGSLDETRAHFAAVIAARDRLREALEDVREQCRNNVDLGALGPGYWSDLQATVDAALAGAK